MYMDDHYWGLNVAINVKDCLHFAVAASWEKKRSVLLILAISLASSAAILAMPKQ